MIKNAFPLFITLATCLLALQSCHKDTPEEATTIKGKVTDVNTGKALGGVEVYYIYQQKIDGKDVYTENRVKTDSSGNFVFIVYGHFSGRVGRDDYQTKNLASYISSSKIQIKFGSENDLGNLKLYPRDGVFKLTLSNTTGKQDKIFGIMDSQIMARENPGAAMGISNESIPLGKSASTFYNVSSNTWVRAYWGPSVFLSFNAPTIDSFYLSKGDTAFYQINF